MLGRFEAAQPDNTHTTSGSHWYRRCRQERSVRRLSDHREHSRMVLYTRERAGPPLAHVLEVLLEALERRRGLLLHARLHLQITYCTARLYGSVRACEPACVPSTRPDCYGAGAEWKSRSPAGLRARAPRQRGSAEAEPGLRVRQKSTLTEATRRSIDRPIDQIKKALFDTI